MKQDTPEKDETTGTISHLDMLKKLRVVIRTAAQHSSWIEKKCGVNGAQLWIMQELHDSGELRVGELAQKLAVHQSTASNLVDGLEKRGLAIKTRNTDDQRVVKVKLSDSGEALLQDAPKPARGLLPEALIKLDQSQRQQLDAGLQSLLDSIEIQSDEYGMLPMPFTV